jgi:predicted membrane-bound dolichyl-phosphate-mannose-protein mannosyltransferase
MLKEKIPHIKINCEHTESLKKYIKATAIYLINCNKQQRQIKWRLPGIVDRILKSIAFPYPT